MRPARSDAADAFTVSRLSISVRREAAASVAAKFGTVTSFRTEAAAAALIRPLFGQTQPLAALTVEAGGQLSAGGSIRAWDARSLLYTSARKVILLEKLLCSIVKIIGSIRLT